MISDDDVAAGAAVGDAAAVHEDVCENRSYDNGRHLKNFAVRTWSWTPLAGANWGAWIRQTHVASDGGWNITISSRHNRSLDDNR